MQTIPGPADIDHIRPERSVKPSADTLTGIPKGKKETAAPIPEEAKSLRLTLKNLKIEGAQAFPSETFQALAAPYIGQDITLDVAYGIANEITQKYRDAGYLLSLAYVPDQKIADGIVTIRIVEGYIGNVEVQGAGNNRILAQYIAQLKKQKPVSSATLESMILRANNLPGQHYRAVLSPMPDMPEGAVKLTLQAEKEEAKGNIGFDNLASRYMGPHEVSLSYKVSLLPLQETTVSGLASLPADELKLVTLEHSIVLTSDVKLGLSANVTHARPGYTLNRLEVESSSTDISAELEYQAIQQRDKNVVLTFKLERRNTQTDILQAPFTRDRIRMITDRAS